MAQVNGVDGNHDVNFVDGNTTLPAVSEVSGSETSIDFLIVGTGPAGAALACFLTQYGKQGSILARPSARLTVELKRSIDVDITP